MPTSAMIPSTGVGVSALLEVLDSQCCIRYGHASLLVTSHHPSAPLCLLVRVINAVVVLRIPGG